MDTIKTESLI